MIRLREGGDAAKEEGNLSATQYPGKID